MENIEYFLLNDSSENYELKLIDSWNKNSLPFIITNLETINFSKNRNLIVDFKELEECDSSAIIYLLSFFKSFSKEKVILKNLDDYEKKYHFYEKYYQDSIYEEKKKNLFLEEMGRATYNSYLETIKFLSFLGKVVYFFIYSIFNPKKIRFKATLKYIETSAINALLIVAVTSFLVGVVIAYQGAVQLEKFGANIFIVEMISITMFREIAPLVTAIVIAGRSASSYTAQIGAMKITEEIDAMKTMNFEPTLFLTLPRIFALCISLPLLVFFSDIVGVFGGMVVATLDLNVSFVEFFSRLGSEVPLKHFVLGIFKSVFFGIAIAIIGCYRGFQVQNNTTSIGKFTTISVVNAIFVVIAIDAMFSVIFTQMGW